MRLEEADERGKQCRLAEVGAKLTCANSGQVDEPLSPTRITERCRKRGKGKSCRISVRLSWRIGNQSLTSAAS